MTIRARNATLHSILLEIYERDIENLIDTVARMKGEYWLARV